MRRLVFHLHGYDPRGPAVYYTLYREEAAKQALVSGQRLAVGPRQATEPGVSAWIVESEAEGASVTTLFEFHRYDDLVRAHWARTPLAVAWESLRYGWQFAWGGIFLRIWRLQPMRVITALLPVGIVVGLVLLLAAATASAGFGARLAGWPGWIGLVVIPPGLWAAHHLMMLVERRTNLPWLARILSFYADEGRGLLPDYEARKDALAEKLVARARSNAYDEIIVSAHSVGCVLAVSVLARALQLDPKLLDHGARVSLLTLGQSIPAVAGLPQARRLREELALLGAAENLLWVDVSSGADPAVFHKVDPITGSGARRGPADPGRPVLVSARFHALFSPESYERLKKDQRLLHQQYLMASEKAGGYDFFALTAGPKPLSAWFGERSDERERDRSPAG